MRTLARPDFIRHPLRFDAAMRVLLAAVLLLVACPLAAQRPALQPVISSVSDAAHWEIAEKRVPSIAVALVDRSGVIWSGAWGRADADGKVAATPGTIYRAGSVSKLFTDVAIMRLVEAGKIDLDKPVRTYLPSFRPHNPFGVPITLRELMTHRSGLVREPPRGNYFDTHPKGQSDTVLSLNDTTLVAKPGTITKYSNAGIAVVGEVVARVSGMPYEEAVDKLVFRPLGMTASGMHPKGAVAYGEMASFDGQRFEAPRLDLGIPAAGNLYTTVGDLGRFAQAMLNKGGGLIKSTTVDEMWRRQYPPSGLRSYGLGFVVGDLDGQRSLSHGGAIYGHVTDLRILPDAGIAVVVFTTVDGGNSAGKLASFALRTMLAAQRSAPLPEFAKSVPVTGEDAKRLTGWFSNGKASVITRIFEDHLVIDAPELVGDVRRAGDRYLVEDAQTLADGLAFAPDGSWLELGGIRYVRGDWPEPPAPPADFAPLIGEYGWEHNILRIYERDGQPFVRIEWTDYRPLTRVDANTYAFPTDRGLYPFEQLKFERDAQGTVLAAWLGGIRFPRRDFGAEVQAVIRSGVKANMKELRAAALEAAPPAEPPARRASDLVAINALDPSIRLDIRYAGTDNYMGMALYEKSDALLQRPAAEAIARANQALHAKGYGLLIQDAYRPWFVTKMFWDATPPASRIFVANPAQGSRHNRGAAVDLTLFDLKTGTPIVMPGRFDETSSRSFSNFVGGSDLERWHRDLLRSAIETQNFAVYSQEWWHFDYAEWRDYPIGNASFEEIDRAKAR